MSDIFDSSLRYQPRQRKPLNEPIRATDPFGTGANSGTPTFGGAPSRTSMPSFDGAGGTLRYPPRASGPTAPIPDGTGRLPQSPIGGGFREGGYPPRWRDPRSVLRGRYTNPDTEPGAGMPTPGQAPNTPIRPEQPIVPEYPKQESTGPGYVLAPRPQAAPVEEPPPEQPRYQPRQRPTASMVTEEPAPDPVTPAPDDPLTAGGPQTEHGRIYNQTVLDRLNGKDSLVENARATESTNASRRNYMARTSAEEMAAQAGVDPATARYQRLWDETMGGARAANQAGENAVNQLARQRNEDALGAARGIEDTTYNRRITERTYKDTKEIQGKTEAQQFVSSLGDINSKAKYTLLKTIAAGGDWKAVYQSLFDDSGTLHPQWRNQSPVQNLRSEAEEWVDLIGPGTNPTTGKPYTREEAIAIRMKEIDTSKRRPMQEGEEQANLQDLQNKVRGLKPGQWLDATELEQATQNGIIARHTLGTIPTAEKVQNFLTQYPSGLVNLDGQQYRVVRGGKETTSYENLGVEGMGPKHKPRHTDYVELQTQDGRTVYAYENGIHDKPPKKAEEPGIADWVLPEGFTRKVIRRINPFD